MEKIDYTKSVLSAGTTAALAYLLVGDASSPVNILGMDMPGIIPLAAGGAASSIAADLAHEYVLPHISPSEKWENAEAIALGLGVSGLVSTAVLDMSGVPRANAGKSFVIGAGGYALADYGNAYLKTGMGVPSSMITY